MSEDDIIDDSLLAKFVAGEATPDEAMLVTDWCEKSPDNKHMLEMLLRAWSMREEANVTAPDKLKNWQSISKKTSSMRTTRVIFISPIRIAAAILFLAAISIFIYRIVTPSTIENQWITKNSHEEIFKLVLPEGTNIVLNAKSELRYAKNFTNAPRNVSLTGEAFFDVAHDSGLPFTIDCQEVTIKVLGTAFNITNQPDATTITTKVTRGKVMMFNKNDSIIINAGWMGIYDKPSKKLTQQKNETENDLGYATHSFTFEDSSVKHVTDNLGSSFGVSFVYENEKIKDCRLTTSYQNKSLSFILDVMAESLNITYTIKGNVVYLSGDGCL